MIAKIENKEQPLRQYIRDHRSPVPANRIASKVMSANKRRNTKPEMLFRKALWANGVRGYRIDWKIKGRPDLAFPAKSVAIFIHGCFWHRCPKCSLPNPKTNSDFWISKFKANVERDARTKLTLESSGWKVITIWECEIKTSVEPLVRRVNRILKNVA